MKRLCLFFVICASLVLGSCRVVGNVVTHQFRNDSVQQHSTNLTNPLYADLDNDGVDEMVAIENNGASYHAVLVFDLTGKRISQINLPYQINALRILSDPRDNKAWLFYSFNDGESTRLMASHYTWGRESKREDKVFASIPRIFHEGERKSVDWNGQIYPEFIADINGDGKMELVARGLCGFQANPRGVFAFDFEKGGLVWYFRTASNVNSLFFDDLNGDGKKEFIFSTFAFKNTEEVVNGIDDMNGYIGILNPAGELIYREMQFPGYGETTLDLKENPHTGLMDIYRVTCTWGPALVKNSVSILNYNGKKLVTRKSSEMTDTLQRLAMVGILKPWDKEGNKRIFLHTKAKGLLVLDENLVPIKHKISTFIKYIWDVNDIDQDGNSEILLETEDGYFMVLNSDLHVKAKIKTPEPEEANMQLQTFNPGFGKDLQISLNSPKARYHYSIIPYPIYKLVWDTIKHYALYIGLLFLLTALLVMRQFYKMVQVNKTATKYLDVGFMTVKHQDKITFANSYIRRLLQENIEAENFGELISLKQYMSPIYKALVDLVHSRERSFTLTTRMSIGKLDGEFKVSITRLTKIPLRHVIIVTPVYIPQDSDKDKLEWADTARRLSHNVRRHITNVILALEPLEKGGTESKSAQHYINLIRSEMEAIRVFTHSFQRFTELKDYELKLQDILPSVEHCLAHAAIPDNIKLIKNWNLSSVPALIEPIRFEEALNNIVTNALEAMLSGGVLHITVKRFMGHEGNGNTQNVLVEIEDSGYGIPQIYMESIYKPFFTTKQSGTGIGIPETVKIIESMRGNVQIQSEEGAGTTVSLWLQGEI